MLIKKLWKSALLLSTIVWGSYAVAAQSGGSLEIKQSVVSNGGGNASGGVYAVDATIGQTVAGDQSTGGNYTEQSGYWTGGTAPVAISQAKPFDFDGDSRTDISIFRPQSGEWWYLRSSDSQNRAFQFGSATDKPVPADYSGDGKFDGAFFRPQSGEWFIIRSENGSYYSVPFGIAGDIPAPGDYDGDGKADVAVFRPSAATWYIQMSASGTAILTFGAADDVPVVADYDGDGKADVAIYRPSAGEWWIQKSSGGSVAFHFGL